MAVPWTPEAVDALRARYPDAVIDVYDHNAIATGRQGLPGNQPKHVFDFPDGLRLIISRDRQADHRSGIVISGSVVPQTPVEERLQSLGPDMATALCDLICERWQSLAGSNRMPELRGWSPGKGVPHFVVWDAH
jgi:hypothetical protein